MAAGDGRLDRLIDETERIGVIGSPSSTAQLAVDILGAAATRKLVGELALFRFTQDAASTYALGQLTEIQLKNTWHEDPTMRSVIRQRGKVEAVSERQDTHLGQMVVSAVFRRGGPTGYEPTILGTVPPTGTWTHLVTDPALDELLSPYRDQIYYLGHVYGSKPKLPLWFKHFDHGPDGAGEAYHLGIFGKTGSGKSVLAKMILLAYARYTQMALLVIDPQGEFARDFRDGPRRGEFALPLGALVEGLHKRKAVLTVRGLVLDRWELFQQILYASAFFERLSMPLGENRQTACSVLVEQLLRAQVKLKDLPQRAAFDTAWRLLGDEKVQRIFYRSDLSRHRFADTLRDADPDAFFDRHWKPVAELFREGRPRSYTVDQVLTWLLGSAGQQRGNRPVLVLDLSGEHVQGLFWNDDIQALVIKRLLDGLKQTAERCYKDDQSLNTLVVIDEAHRLASRDIPRDEGAARDVRATLVDAARTTRKYGLGWLFISQTLSSLDREILQQLRIFFFGFGLALGQEFQALSQLVGSSGTALDLYRLFRDPHSAFDVASRQYSFMTVGPVSPLSFSGSPLFLNAFNTVEAFLHANRFGQQTNGRALRAVAEAPPSSPAGRPPTGHPVPPAQPAPYRRG
jgi:Helicase HerA, central domain